LVVGVGASAGGLAAFRRLLSALPADGGMAFVLVQHLDPEHESRLAELLSPHTPMSVVEVTGDTPIRPDTVYVIAPGTTLGVRDGRVQPSQADVRSGVRLPVDDLFRALARDCGSTAVSIVLSGDGSDGSAGVRDVKARGGLVIAQEPKESEHAGMPNAAIASGAVELVLRIEAMPAALERFAALPARTRLDPTADLADHPTDDVAGDVDGDEHDATRATLGVRAFDQLAGMLQTQLDFDVRVYKTGTVQRRLERRMMLSGFERADAYLDHLKGAPAELRLLQRDLLISVTEFFRDSDAFEALRTTVVDPLVARTSDAEELRVWVPGCATGEEAYSVAITFLESMRAHDKRCALQVFATDVDRFALTVARSGHYPHSIVEHLSGDCLARYFRPRDEYGHQVLPILRDCVLFSAHDLTNDPPFSHMNLVSCRNVLIYLSPSAQQDVLTRLHFSLVPEGNLFIGRSESITSDGPRFAPVSQAWRIYQKAGRSPALPAPRSRSRPALQGPAVRSADEGPRRVVRGTESDLARQAVLAAWVAPSLVVSTGGAVVFAHGDLSPYLRFPEGNIAHLELPAIVRPEFATRTLTAVYKCRREKETVVVRSSPDGEHGIRVHITAKLAPTLGDDAVILTFQPVDEGEVVPSSTMETPLQEAVIGQLDEELQATREDLQTTAKELENSIEELRSSSEESLSMNEELQAANEELEASTEELRSLNDELSTVNAQLREKIVLVEQTHDDLQNFFTSSRVATTFLDQRLRVKRFTPAAAEILRLDERDVGRFVGDIAHELLQHDLQREATEGLNTLSSQTREINTRQGRWVARQILPYRTSNGRIDGVVVTFTDITDVKTATERLALRQRQQAVIARTGLQALRDMDLQRFMDQAVREIQQTLDTDACSILELQPGGQRLLLRAGVDAWGQPKEAAFVSTGADSQAGYALQSGEPMIVEDRATDKRLSRPPPLAEAGSVSGVTCVIRVGDHDYGILAARTTTRRVFAPEDATFLQAMAVVIGSAIERIQSRLRMALGRDVAQVLAQAGTTEATLRHVLECFATLLPIAVAEAWWRAPDGESLARTILHVTSADERVEVDRAFGRTCFAVGEGVVGRVFQAARATWYTDLGEHAGFFRRESSVALGLVSAFVLPVQSGTKVLGVLTLFSRQRLVADEALLRSLEMVGRSIGDFVARQEIKQRVRTMAAITESSHDAIVSYGQDGQVTRWLRGAEDLFGFPRAEMLGQSIERIVPVECREELWEAYARIQHGEVVEPFETGRQRKDGTRVEVSVRSVAVRDGNGEVVAVSSTERDVTRLKLTERRLLAADQQKNEFLAMLGHELRNPLAAIRNAADLLECSPGEDPNRLRIQAILQRQSAHMSKLLDGLLDVARMIRGKVTLERRPVDLVDVCREVLSDVAPRVAARAIELREDLPSEEVWVEGDRIRLVQIIDNLLSNSLKYTERGGSVLLVVSATAETATVTLRDTGVGIEADSMPHIFEVFHQSRRSLGRGQEGGLGLGLALVKSLVELHGGRVTATSGGKDQGAEFVIRLPVTLKRRAPVPEPSLQRDEPLRILLIEDNEDSAEMMCLLLQRAGHEVRVATRGDQGVTMAKASPPDVIVCDIGLPHGVTGLDVARQLRSDAMTQHIPMVALTGYGAPQDKEASREAGFDVHLTKPVDARTLRRVLATLPRADPPH
jgi:two-component system CheB/CheR fusion protein